MPSSRVAEKEGGDGYGWDKKYSPYNFIHESFAVNNPNRFTRGWFAWVNAQFGEWIDTMVREGTLPESRK